MEPDYKEQLRMMTEGLGQWLDQRERRRRKRRRIMLAIAAVAAAVVLQIFFPWRREEVKVYYVNEHGDTLTERPTAKPDNGQHSQASESSAKHSFADKKQTASHDSAGMTIKDGEDEIKWDSDGLTVKSGDDEVRISTNGLSIKTGKSTE